MGFSVFVIFQSEVDRSTSYPHPVGFVFNLHVHISTRARTNQQNQIEFL